MLRCRTTKKDTKNTTNQIQNTTVLSRRTSIASKSSGWSPARSLPPGFIWRDFNWVFRDLIGSAQYHMNHYQSWITLNKPCGNGFLQNLNNLELIFSIAMHWCLKPNQIWLWNMWSGKISGEQNIWYSRHLIGLKTIFTFPFPQWSYIF